jgi:hypothetical protein
VAPPGPVAVAVMFVEQVSTIGGETTVTVKLQLVVCPQVSLAVQFTMFVPMEKVLPLGGLQLTVGAVQPPVAELE